MKVLIIKHHNYGFQVGQIKDLPEQSAQMLINRGIAEPVQSVKDEEKQVIKTIKKQKK